MQDIYIIGEGLVVRAHERYVCPRPGPHMGEVYGGTDFVAPDKLAEIGAVPYREEGPPEGMAATSWSEGLEEGCFVRRAVAWEALPAPTPSPPVLTANEFVRRFTAEEQAAIWASAEPQVVVLRNLVLSARDGIRLDDAETLDGMALLVGLGLLDEARAQAILPP